MTESNHNFSSADPDVIRDLEATLARAICQLPEGEDHITVAELLVRTGIATVDQTYLLSNVAAAQLRAAGWRRERQPFSRKQFWYTRPIPVAAQEEARQEIDSLSAADNRRVKSYVMSETRSEVRGSARAAYAEHIVLLKALGATDVRGVRRVTLVIEGMNTPRVTIERDLMESDGLVKALQYLDLETCPAPKAGA